MSKKDYIPTSDSEFFDFQDTFVSVVNTNKAGWDFSPTADTEWTLLTNTVGVKKKLYDDTWSIVKTGSFTRPERLAFLNARQSYESGKMYDPTDTSIRLFISRYIRNNKLVTIEQKAAMGLTIPDEVKTPSTPPSEGNLLVGSVKSATHLAHHNEIGVPGQDSKAKEDYVENIHVFIAFTDASVKTAPDEKEFVYDGIVKYGVYDRNFAAEQEGKRAWYFAKVMSKGKGGSYGPPSSTWNGVIL